MSAVLLSMVRAMCDEKNLEPEVVFEAIEHALAAAVRKNHKVDIEARVEIDRATGQYKTFRRWEVMDDEEEIEEPDRQIYLSAAKEDDSDVEIGGWVEEPIPNVELGRITAQTARQVVTQKVREAERARVIREFEPRVGSMVFGQVKRLDRGDAIVEIGGVEATLFRSNSIPNDGLRVGDRIRAILKEVRHDTRGPTLILDRTSPKLLIDLFNLEVPETREGFVKILHAARDPGQRAKIAVHSDDPRIDPIGACVGVRGTRVQSVSNEIAGERVDIIRFSQNAVQFVINALAPAQVDGIDVDEEKHSMDIAVSDSQLSQAIGRGGQNVRLASELTGWTLNILTSSAAEEKASKESDERREHLKSELNMDDDVALILVQEGFRNLEDIVYTTKEDLLKIEEFDESLVVDILDRAQNVMLMRAISGGGSDSGNTPDETLLTMSGMDEGTAWMLARYGVCTMEDLAESAVDEIAEAGISEERAAELIMTARAPWFEELDVET